MYHWGVVVDLRHLRAGMVVAYPLCAWLVKVNRSHLLAAWPTKLHSAARIGTVDSFICMMTSSNGNIFGITGILCGEFTGHRWIPGTKANDAELWCFLWSAPEYTLSKQSRDWWFETPSCSLWRHCNGFWHYNLTNKYIPQYMGSAITCPYPWYLLLAHKFSNVTNQPTNNRNSGLATICGNIQYIT